MKTQTVQQSAVSRFQQFAKRIAEKLPTKTTDYFLSLITGALLAIARRRTVTQWLKAAQMSDKFRQAFHHLPNIAWCPSVIDNEGTLFAWEYWDFGIITDELLQLPSQRAQSRLRAKMHMVSAKRR